MRPHMLTPTCLFPVANSRSSPFALAFALIQPYLSFLYPPWTHLQSLASYATAHPTQKNEQNDPWSFLLGHPDPNARVFKDSFRHSPPRPRTNANKCYKFPSAYFPTALSHYQEHSRSLPSPQHPAASSTAPYPRHVDPTYSTITERERAIFTTIFESILSESPTPHPITTATTSTARNYTSVLTALFESAVGPQLCKGQLSFGPSDPRKASFMSAAMARASAIPHYPPSLRFAAAHAAGLPGVPLTEDEEQEEVKRCSELIKLINQMCECKTDLELLDFMDKNVFTMVSPDVSTAEAAGNSLSLKFKGQKYTFPSASYAELLAEGMKLLSRSFRDPSSTITIFHRIKSLGAESYVVGCSVAVYNLVIQAKWGSYRDLDMIEQLLDEMRVNGIEGDLETVQVLRAIINDSSILNQELIGMGAPGLSVEERNSVNKLEKSVMTIMETLEVRHGEREREVEKQRERDSLMQAEQEGSFKGTRK